MLKNYLKIISRNLWRQKGYTLINILGLAVGLSSCIIILLYVFHEFSYDRFNKKANRIYRVAANIDFSGNHYNLPETPALMGPTLQKNYASIESAVRIRVTGSQMVRKGNSNVRENRVAYADSTLFKVFTLPMLYGNPSKALTAPHSVVITKSIAKKYFGKTDVVGKTLLFNDKQEYKITGVIKDIPETSHFHFDFLLSMSSFSHSRNRNWLSNNFYTYLLLKKGVPASRLRSIFASLKKTYIEPELKHVLGVNFKQFKAAGNKYQLYPQPLLKIHLHSHLQGEIEPNGNILYIYIFSGLAFFILILACINFMNLTTARSARRAREVGIRKTLGGRRSQLSLQFFAESILLSFLSFLFAIVITEFTLPFFSRIAGFHIRLSRLFDLVVLFTIMGIVLVTGIIAGSYPALRLSAFQPARVLKGTTGKTGGHGLFRHILVVFQFTISIIIITGMLVINKQLNYIQHRSPGFNKEHVIIVNDAHALGKRVKSFKQALLSYSFVKDVTATSFLPVYGYSMASQVFWPGGRPVTQNNGVDIQVWTVDRSYLKTMGMKITKGRNFVKGMASDSDAVILNQTAAAQFRLKNPVGKKIRDYAPNPDGSINKNKMASYKVIGVVKDFNYRSMHQKIGPLALFLGRDSQASAIAFRIKPGSSTKALARLKKIWKNFAPNQPLNYTFMNQRFDEFYRADMRVKALMLAFSILAILIACLGLLGLSAYSVERRTKEIGIRKVMGAGVGNIVRLISWEFLKLVTISFVIAVPVAWYIMRVWLRDFAYRTDMGTGVFIVAGIGSLLVALITVSWQSIRAALMNPVDALRSE